MSINLVRVIDVRMHPEIISQVGLTRWWEYVSEQEMLREKMKAVLRRMQNIALVACCLYS